MPTLDIQLKPSTPEDEIFVNDLTRSVMKPYVESTWPDEESREHYYHINRFNLQTTAIIYFNGERIGRVTLTNSDSEIVLEDIHILPEHQGKGIGKQLIEEVLKQARSEGKSVALMVLRTNPAQSLYNQLGFKTYQETEERFYMRYLS